MTTKKELEALLNAQQKEITDLKRYIGDIWRVIKLTNENVDGISAFLKKNKTDWQKWTS